MIFSIFATFFERVRSRPLSLAGGGRYHHYFQSASQMDTYDVRQSRERTQFLAAEQNICRVIRRKERERKKKTVTAVTAGN